MEQEVISPSLPTSGTKIKWLIADTAALLDKYLLMTWRMPIWTLFGLVQPLLWLIIFGQLFKNLARLPGFPEADYVRFLAPGVIVMTVLFGSSWSGVSLLRDLNFGIMEKLLVAPISRTAIVLSRLLHTGLTVVIQVILLIGVAALLGAGLPYDAGLFWIWAVVLLLALAFSGISNALAMILKKEEPLVVMGNMLTLPLLFFSPALVPTEFMPAWMQMASRINPVTYGVEAVRACYRGTFDSAFWTSMGVLALFMVASVISAVSIFGKDRT
ncbi:MAG: ABC transporter permease [Candidatus Manganitrophaceae bacterium]